MIAGPPPQVANGSLTWSSRGIRAELTARSHAEEIRLHDSVTWRCVMPSADARVELPDRTLCGVGYAEVLEMSVAPWQLPIRELYWGRATCNDTSLVWIRWSGEQPLTVVLRDGVSVAASAVEDDEVRLADGTRIEMSERAVLREETLANVLRPLRGIASLLPRSLTGAMERKWRSRGTVFAGERRIDEGWVIHERVTFA